MKKNLAVVVIQTLIPAVAIVGLGLLHHLLWWGSFNCLYVLGLGVCLGWFLFRIFWKLPQALKAWKNSKKTSSPSAGKKNLNGFFTGRTLKVQARNLRGRSFGPRFSVSLGWIGHRKTTALLILAILIPLLSLLLCGLLNR